jgi:hypothetical protein
MKNIIRSPVDSRKICRSGQCSEMTTEEILQLIGNNLAAANSESEDDNPKSR